MDMKDLNGMTFMNILNFSEIFNIFPFYSQIFPNICKKKSKIHQFSTFYKTFVKFYKLKNQKNLPKNLFKISFQSLRQVFPNFIRNFVNFHAIISKFYKNTSKFAYKLVSNSITSLF